MWHVEHTLETTASPEAVWRCLTEVQRWPEWEDGLEWVRLEGPFASGSSLVLKHRQGSRESFRLGLVEAGRFVEGIRKGFLYELRVNHRLEASELGTRLTRRIQVSGLLSGLLHVLWGRRYRLALPEAARKLAREAGRA